MIIYFSLELAFGFLAAAYKADSSTMFFFGVSVGITLLPGFLSLVKDFLGAAFSSALVTLCCYSVDETSNVDSLTNVVAVMTLG